MTTWLTEREACEKFKISRGAAARWLDKARHHIGRSVRYDEAEAEAIIKKEEQCLTSLQKKRRGERAGAIAM